MTLSAAQDIDFIMWGPFPNIANAIANCNSYSAADIVPNLPNGCGGFFGPTCTQQGCSYSASNIETPSINNAIAGEVYVLLVTNYANFVQNISLVQSGGTGGTHLVRLCSQQNRLVPGQRLPTRTTPILGPVTKSVQRIASPGRRPGITPTD